MLSCCPGSPWLSPSTQAASEGWKPVDLAGLGGIFPRSRAISWSSQGGKGVGGSMCPSLGLPGELGALPSSSSSDSACLFLDRRSASPATCRQRKQKVRPVPKGSAQGREHLHFTPNSSLAGLVTWL